MRRPITPILTDRLGTALLLAPVACVRIAIGGVLLGLVTAWYEGSRLDRTLNGLAAIGTSLPEFVRGTVLVQLVGGGLFSLFPPSGYNGLHAGFGDVASHLFLPALTLAMILIAYVVRV